jgi:hypothetical protein
MPLKIDKLIATEVFVDGNEVTGKEGTLTNILISLNLNLGEFGEITGTFPDLFWGSSDNGQIYNQPNLSLGNYSIYEDNNGLIHIGVLGLGGE